MKNYRFEQTGQEVPIEQLKEEMKECGIKLNDQRWLVRWNHENLGIVFDTEEMYRKICGHEVRSLNKFRPIDIATI